MREQESDPRSALTGCRLVEACEGVGGPYAAMLLSDHGVDVLKIEPPAGDRLRGNPAFHVLNRGKQRRVLDLNTPAGRTALTGLLRDADVFLHDWTPGVAEQRGFDVAALHALNPRLIVGHLPPYGTNGPYAKLFPDEGLMQAIGGLCDAQWRYGEPPVLINLPVAGYAQGIVGAIAVAASLFARQRRGRGDAFIVSGLAAILAMETVAYISGPGVMRLAGRSDPLSPIPTYRLVQCADDWLFVGALTPAFWASLAAAVGLEDCLVDARFDGAPLGIASPEDRAELAARVSAAFTTKTRAEWRQILDAADIPNAPVLTRAQYVLDPQVRHNQMLIEIDDPELGRTQQPGSALSLRHSPPQAGRQSLPWSTQAGPDVVNRAPGSAGARAQGSSVSETGGSVGRPAPLDGVVVLDLGGFIAGANATMLLADLGATVIKVEGPDGDGWRTSGLAFLGSNRGKRGLCLDLKQPEARDLFLDLVAQADVVLDNVRPGVLERLGLGYDVLSQRNPRIVHCSVTAYGPTGPYAARPGFDPLIQAQSGLMRAQGDPDDEPVYLQVPVCDYATALMAAYGVLLALVAREHSGHGDRVETCLANNAFTMQAGEFIDYANRPPADTGGRDLAGRTAVYRIYPCGDGYLFLACTQPAQVESLLRVLQLTGPAPEDALTLPLDGPLAEAIARRLAGRPRAELCQALGETGVPCAPCTPVGDLFADPHLNANALWWDTDHPQWGHVRQTGAAVQWQELGMRIERRAPLLGEHSVEVLRELGVPADRVASLRDKGIVQQARP